MDCPKCGAKNLTDTKFCPTCGFNLEIDKKLGELRENSTSTKYPPKPTAMCYCPDPDYEWDDRKGKLKKKRLWGCILGIIVVLTVGLIIYLLK